MSPTFVYGVAIAAAAVAIYGILRAWSRREEEAEEAASENGPPPEIRVLSRMRMGRGRQLVVVEVEGRRLLLGSTRSEWCALADIGSSASKPADDPFAQFDAELSRAMQATRYRKGWKHS
jgi:flagellar biogenesis protein FliO